MVLSALMSEVRWRSVDGTERSNTQCPAWWSRLVSMLRAGEELQQRGGAGRERVKWTMAGLQLAASQAAGNQPIQLCGLSWCTTPPAGPQSCWRMLAGPGRGGDDLITGHSRPRPRALISDSLIFRHSDPQISRADSRPAGSTQT